MAELRSSGDEIQQKLDKNFLVDCLRKANLPSNCAAFSYTEYKSPLIPFKKVRECQKIVLDYHDKWSGNKSNNEKRIEEDNQIALQYLIVHGGYSHFMIVGTDLPLLIEYTILIINGKDVNIATMLTDRIYKAIDEYKVNRSDIINLIKYN